MEATLIVVFVLGTLFLSSLVRSSLGFGDAMVAMPLLTLLIPLRTATPIVALLSTSMAVFILLQDRKEVDFGATWKLSLGAMVGVPLGALLLTQLDEWIVKAFLGALVMSFCVFRLSSPQLSELKTDTKAPIFGFFSGVFGGAYNTFGPPIVVYGVMRRWKAETYRVSVQGFYLPVCVVVLACHAYNGLWNGMVFRYYLAAIPVVIVATMLGRKVNQALGNKGGFDRVVYFALIVVAMVLLYTALRASGYSPFPWDP